MSEELKQLQTIIRDSKRILFFGGAGVSTESGLPDYRSKEGTYTKMEEQKKDPKKIMNKRFMIEHPEEFFNQIPRRSNPFTPKPNPAHLYLADLERRGKDVRIVTQNVDGLHQAAGSKLVVELHGNNRHFHCVICGREYPYQEIRRDAQNVPRCPIDNGIIRSDVILFGENLTPGILERARELIETSDLLIIAGTSLSVNPAKNLIRHFNGGKVVIINKTPLKPVLTVDLTIQDAVGKVFGQLQATHSSTA